MRISAFLVLRVIWLLILFSLCSGCEVLELHVDPGNATILRGESVKVNVNVVRGRPTKIIGIQTKKAGATEWSESKPMDPNDGGYVYVFRDIEQSFEYRLDTKAKSAGPFVIDVNDYKGGRDAAKRYIDGDLADYRLVIMLHDIDLSKRKEFLDGFMAAFTDASRKEDGLKYSKILEEAVSGNQFETARESGVKHAQRLVTNSQIQSLIHSSLGVSGSVALGWKAGYIEGFKTQKVSEAKDRNESVEKQDEQKFYKDAAATYNALRAATGQ